MIIWDDKESRETVFRIEKGFLVKHKFMRCSSKRVVTHYCFYRVAVSAQPHFHQIL